MGFVMGSPQLPPARLRQAVVGERLASMGLVMRCPLVLPACTVTGFDLVRSGVSLNGNEHVRVRIVSARPIAYVALGLYRDCASVVDDVFVFQRCCDHLSCINAFEMDVAIKIVRLIMIACRGHWMHSVGVLAWATIAQGSCVRFGRRHPRATRAYFFGRFQGFRMCCFLIECCYADFRFRGFKT